MGVKNLNTYLNCKKKKKSLKSKSCLRCRKREFQRHLGMWYIRVLISLIWLSSQVFIYLLSSTFINLLAENKNDYEGVKNSVHFPRGILNNCGLLIQWWHLHTSDPEEIRKCWMKTLCKSIILAVHKKSLNEPFLLCAGYGSRPQS